MSIMCDGECIRVTLDEEFPDDTMRKALVVALNPRKYLGVFVCNTVILKWAKHHITAEICVSRAPFDLDGRSYENLELRVVNVDEDHRRQGHFGQFMDRFIMFCCEIKRVLLITEVCGGDLEKMLTRKPDRYVLMPDRPQSYYVTESVQTAVEFGKR